MKDLKHLIFFENLLQDAQNELVTQAVNDGKIALGYNCYYIPEVLLNLPRAALRVDRRCDLLHDQPCLPVCPLHPRACH